MTSGYLKHLYLSKLTVDALYARNKFYNRVDTIERNTWDMITLFELRDQNPNQLSYAEYEAITTYYDYEVALKRRDNYGKRV